MTTALDGAFRKGQEAFRAGDGPNDCPYQDKRKADGRLTWSRAFRTAWREGFYYELEAAAKNRRRRKQP